MDVFKVLRDFILADPALAAALGTRVYPIKLPQSGDVSGDDDSAHHGRRVHAVERARESRAAALSMRRLDAGRRRQRGGGGVADRRAALDRLEGAVFTVRTTRSIRPSRGRSRFEFETDRDAVRDGRRAAGSFRYSADYFVVHQTGHGT